MKKIVILMFIFLCFIAYSQDEYDRYFNDLTIDDSKIDDALENKAISSDIGLKVSVTGNHTFEFHAPVINNHFDFNGYSKSPKFNNEIGIDISFKQIKFVSHWELDLILNQWNEWTKLLEVTPLENYISWRPWKFIFNAGFQFFNWGTADGFNPTDNVNIKNYRNPTNPEKESVFSIYAGFFPANFISIEALYIPLYLNYSNKSVDRVKKMYPASSISVNDSNFKPEYFGLGTKINVFTRYVDFSFSYFTGMDPYYSARLKLEEHIIPFNNYYSLESIELFNRRLHHIGGDLKASVGIFGIWLELCYTISEDYLMQRDAIRNHQFNWATGFDFSYGPDGDFYVNIQYFGTYNPLYYQDFYTDYENGEPVFNKSEEYYKQFYYRTLTDSLKGITEGLTQSLSLEMNWPLLNSKLTPSLNIIYSLPLLYDTAHDIRYGSLYVNPELDIMPVTTFNIVIGAELFFSWVKKDGIVDINYNNPIGSHFENGNIYIEVRYKWGIDVER